MSTPTKRLLSCEGLLLGIVFSVWSMGGLSAQQHDRGPKPPPRTPAIVHLQIFASPSKAEGETKKPMASCLGFVVETGGMILTSYQPLIDPASGALRPIIEVHGLNHGEPTPLAATIVAVEPTLNFAILNVETSKDLESSKICPRDEKIVAGLEIFAASSANKKTEQFSTGKITDLNSMECYQETMTATMLQAAIEIPDSALGGPIFNRKGEVVAIHTGYRPADGEKHEGADIEVGKIHILPIFLVFNIYEAVKLKGNVKSPWTGFSVRTLTKEEKSTFPLGRFSGGVGIDAVWDGSPAAKLGIRKDDILVAFSYYPTENVAAFQKWLYMYGVGFKVKLHFLRDQRTYFSVDYTIEERPASAQPK